MPSWQLQKCPEICRPTAFNFHNRWRVSQETRRGWRVLLWITANRFWRAIIKLIPKDISLFWLSSLFFVLQGISVELFSWHRKHSVEKRRQLKKRVITNLVQKSTLFCCRKGVSLYSAAKGRKENALAVSSLTNESSGLKSLHNNHRDDPETKYRARRALHHPYPRTFCTLPSFARNKRPRWRLVELNERHLRSHGKIGDDNMGAVGLTACGWRGGEEIEPAVPPTTPTHWHFVLSLVLPASRDQDDGLSNSTIDIYDLTEKCNGRQHGGVIVYTA